MEKFMEKFMGSELTVSWQDTGSLIVQSENLQIEYPKGKANQIILCARMNPWDRFIAMLGKTTEEKDWTPLNSYLTSLDKSAAWKIKEKFARLSTNEQ